MLNAVLSSVLFSNDENANIDTNHGILFDTDLIDAFEFDYQLQLDALIDGTSDVAALFEASPTSFTSSNIVFGDNVTGVSITGLSLSGVTNIEDLNEAQSEALANGYFDEVVVLDNGIEILTLTGTASSLTLTSGTQSIVFEGMSPGSFSSLESLVDILSDLGDPAVILSDLELQNYVTTLQNYGFSGITFKDGTDILVGLTLTETSLSVEVAGATLNVTGQFPTENLGELAQALIDLDDADPTTLLSDLGLGFSELVLTAADGTQMVNISGSVETVGDAAFDTVVVNGTSLDDRDISIADFSQEDASSVVMNGLGGNDVFDAHFLIGLVEYDYYGIGLAPTTINGGDGYDEIDLRDFNYTGTYEFDFSGVLKGFSASEDEVFSISHSSIERLDADTNGSLYVNGSSGDDVLTLGQVPRYLEFFAGAGTDLLELHRMEWFDSASGSYGFGITEAGFMAEYDLRLSTDGAWQLFSSYDFNAIGEIRNVENIRLKSSTDHTVTVPFEQLTSEDDFLGTDGADTLTGTENDNMVVGLGGADELSGLDGSDTLVGGSGDDYIYGGAGFDYAVLDSDIDDATVSLGTDGVFIQSAADGFDFIANDVERIVMDDRYLTYTEVAALAQGPVALDGTNNGETLTGTSANEIINGLDGWDWIIPGRGNDTVDGGTGRDMVSYSDVGEVAGRGTAFMLDLDLGAGTAKIFGGEVDQLTSIERVTGSIYADVLRGTDGDDELRGIGDYDWFVATTGNDTLNGGNGLDMITFLEWGGTGAAVIEDIFSINGAPPIGSAAGGITLDLSNPGSSTGLAQGLTLISIERVTGSSYQDVFFGDGNENDFRGLGGYDWFVGSTGGRERYFGGDGLDTVTYYQSSAGISASLRNGAGFSGGQETGYGSAGDAVRDLYFEIENLVGTAFNDSLTGNEERNQLSGLDGDDFIFGFGGTDYIKGGKGNDTIDGGAGSDFALYDGDLAEYTITRTSATDVTIAHADGIDSLSNVQYFQFDDVDANIWQFAIV